MRPPCSYKTLQTPQKKNEQKKTLAATSKELLLESDPELLNLHGHEVSFGIGMILIEAPNHLGPQRTPSAHRLWVFHLKDVSRDAGFEVEPSST